MKLGAQVKRASPFFDRERNAYMCLVGTDSAFEDRPETFNRVRVDRTDYLPSRRGHAANLFR